MGLDMYLTKELYVSKYSEEGIKVRAMIDSIAGLKKMGTIESLVFEVAYWRKANHIHNWFVNNVQDGVDECIKTWVGTEKLGELLALCKAVLKDHSKAEALLPTVSGFLFGSTEYDDAYYIDIKDTITMIEAELLVTNGCEYYYCSSW